MNIDQLLGLLDGLKVTGQSKWLARCPAHDDSHPSLSIRALDDGRVLLHCWSGCETEAVLSAIGLTFSDLFPQALADHASRVRLPFNAADVLAALELEATTVLIAASDLAHCRPIRRDRLLLAVERISAAVEATRRG